MPTPEAARPPLSSAPGKKRGPVFWAFMAVAVLGGGGWLVNFLHHAYLYTETDDAYVAGMCT